MRRIALRISFALLSLSLLSCGGSKPSPGSAAAPFAPDAPSLSQLSTLLDAEFAKLGIDPSKITAQAPTGSYNTVFDLALIPLDALGQPVDISNGGDPADIASLSLEWTERMLGDFDQNGIVAVQDLTPIGQSFQQSVSYDAAELHGGIAHWPAGDPDEATPSGGAANWRRARVDGNGDGKVTVQDLPAIAMHFKERLSGYRVYRQAPSGSGYVLLPVAPEDAAEPDASEMTCPRSAHNAPSQTTPDQTKPVRYGFAEPLSGAGVYRYYITPYDAVTDTEGQPSAVISIDTSTGIVNQAPVAVLTVTPDFAGAPAVITLDASASYDIDGTVAVYEWDLDGDGTVDYRSDDPAPPEQSSNGTVTEIVPDAQPSKLTANYIQGSDSYYHPTVRAYDDQNLASTAAGDQLGISGWVKEFITSDADPRIPLDRFNLLWNPVKQRVICYGVRDLNPEGTPFLGFYYAERIGPDDWTPLQLCCDMSDPDFTAWLEESPLQGFGGYFGQPFNKPTFDSSGNLFLINGVSKGSATIEGATFAIIQDGDSWDYRPLYMPPGNVGTAGVKLDPVRIGPTRFAFIAVDHPPGSEFNNFLMEYDTATKESLLDEPIWDNTSGTQDRLPTDLEIDNNGNVVIVLRGDSSSVPILTRTAPNIYAEQGFDVTALNLIWGVKPKLVFNPNGSFFLHIDAAPGPTGHSTTALIGAILGQDSILDLYDGFDYFEPAVIDEGEYVPRATLVPVADHLSALTQYGALERLPEGNIVHERVNFKVYAGANSKPLVENWIDLDGSFGQVKFQYLGGTIDGQSIGWMGGALPEFGGQDHLGHWAQGHYLMLRVDPRS